MDPINLKRLYSIDFDERIVQTVLTPDQGWLINFDNSSEVIRLDSHFNTIWRKDLQVQTQDFSHCLISVSPNNKMIAFAGKDSIRITDHAGNLLHQIKHFPWESYSSTQCYFLSDNQYAFFVTPTTKLGDDLLHVIDLTSFKIMDSAPIIGWDGHYTFYLTPQADIILLEVAAGQDGSGLYQVQFTNGKLHLTELPQCFDRVMGNFAPSGKEFVTAPHFDGVIRVYSFPQINEIAAIEEESVFGVVDEDSPIEEDMFDYYAKYATNELILTKTHYNRLLLIDRQRMECINEIIPEGYQIQGYDERGKFTDDPSKITGFQGDIDNFIITRDQKLITFHNSTCISIYDMQNIINNR